MGGDHRPGRKCRVFRIEWVIPQYKVSARIYRNGRYKVAQLEYIVGPPTVEIRFVALGIFEGVKQQEFHTEPVSPEIAQALFCPRVVIGDILALKGPFIMEFKGFQQEAVPEGQGKSEDPGIRVQDRVILLFVK